MAQRMRFSEEKATFICRRKPKVRRPHPSDITE